MMKPGSNGESGMAGSWLERVKSSFGEVGRSIHKLFLEVTGFLFAVFGGFLLLRGYQFVSEREVFEFKDYFMVGSFALFGLLMLGFAVHSFFRVRSMK